MKDVGAWRHLWLMLIVSKGRCRCAIGVDAQAVNSRFTPLLELSPPWPMDRERMNATQRMVLRVCESRSIVRTLLCRRPLLTIHLGVEKKNELPVEKTGHPAAARA